MKQNKKIFINLTRHQLTDKQLQRLKELEFDEIYNLDDIIKDESVKNLLLQSPRDIQILKAVAKSVKVHIEQKIKSKTNSFLTRNYVYVQLPIGSPLQQALLFLELISDFKVVYSHSKRRDDANEEFEFEDFIIVDHRDIADIIDNYCWK